MSKASFILDFRSGRKKKTVNKMTIKQTPEIIIPPMKIGACEDCPFFTMNVNDYGERVCYCSKSPYNWDDMRGFDNPRKIWDECPLPTVE